jgi:hypothetical protein
MEEIVYKQDKKYIVLNSYYEHGFIWLKLKDDNGHIFHDMAMDYSINKE